MKNLFLPYELSILAKEKGFNEPCLTWYLSIGVLNEANRDLRLSNFNTDTFAVSAPIYQQIIDWLREEHRIIVSVDVSPYTPSLNWGYVKSVESKIGKWTNEQENPLPYYEALNKAIKEALILLK